MIEDDDFRPLTRSAVTGRFVLRGQPPASGPARLLAGLRSAGWPDLVEPTQAWLANLRTETSRGAYSRDLSWWLAWCRETQTHPVAAAREQAGEYAEAVQDTGLAATSQARRLSTMSSWYKHLIRAGLAERNPLESVARPDPTPAASARVLSGDELARMVGVARTWESSRTYALLLVLCLTASGPGPVLRATVDDLVTIERHPALQLGTGARRQVKILPTLAAAALDAYLADRGNPSDGPLFATRQGRPVDEPAVLRMVRRVARRANIPAPEQISPLSLAASARAAAEKIGFTTDARGGLDSAAAEALADQLIGDPH